MNLSVNGYFVDYLWFMLFDTPFYFSFMYFNIQNTHLVRYL